MEKARHIHERAMNSLAISQNAALTRPLVLLITLGYTYSFLKREKYGTKYCRLAANDAGEMNGNVFFAKKAGANVRRLMERAKGISLKKEYQSVKERIIR